MGKEWIKAWATGLPLCQERVMTGKFCIKLLLAALPNTSCYCLQLSERLGFSMLDSWGGAWPISRLCRIGRIIWLPLAVILFCSNLGCLRSVAFAWRSLWLWQGPACSTMEQLGGSGPIWEQQQKLQPCSFITCQAGEMMLCKNSLPCCWFPSSKSRIFEPFERVQELLLNSLWGGYGFLAEIKAVSECVHLFPLS